VLGLTFHNNFVLLPMVYQFSINTLAQNSMNLPQMKSQVEPNSLNPILVTIHCLKLQQSVHPSSSTFYSTFLCSTKPISLKQTCTLIDTLQLCYKYGLIPHRSTTKEFPNWTKHTNSEPEFAQSLEIQN
jgi:hypothetical protein